MHTKEELSKKLESLKHQLNEVLSEIDEVKSEILDLFDESTLTVKIIKKEEY